MEFVNDNRIVMDLYYGRKRVRQLNCYLDDFTQMTFNFGMLMSRLLDSSSDDIKFNSIHIHTSNYSLTKDTF